MAPLDAHLPRPPLHHPSLFQPCVVLLLLLSYAPAPTLVVAQDGSQPKADMPTGLNDGMNLVRFKQALGSPAVLSSWMQGVNPCGDTRAPWTGVICAGGIVTGLRLGGMGLSGTINETAVEPLANIQGLRTISLANNKFSGDIPPFGVLVALKSVFLSNNHFSGAIDGDYFSDMAHLKKVWLSENAFTGKIPSSLLKLSLLMELHLEDNQFSGAIPDMDTQTLTSFNVSNNKLEGEVPAGLQRFDESAFTGNVGLCGPKTGKTSCEGAVASSPASASDGKEVESGRAVMVSVVLAMLLLALIAGLVIVKKRREDSFDTLGVENGSGDSVSVSLPRVGGSSKRSSSSTHRQHDSSRKSSISSKRSAGGGDAHGELVMVNQDKGAFALSDLMKAAAEVLGNGGLGSAYKAVMANGVAVVVKRMRDLNRMGRDGFEAEIRRLGRLRHPNILTPLAYHYRKEEKLLIFEYVEKGSLLYALHGDRGVHHAALDWPTRLRIIKGVAKGMVYLHTELASSDVPHGNLKSGNILLGPEYEPLLVDYGYLPLVNPSQASVSMFAYKSPEAVQHRQVSGKSDVYCLGVVILELLTGKFPSQYLNNGKGGTDVVEWAASAIADRREIDLIDPEIVTGTKQSVASMEQLLRIGATCVDPRPESRPDAREAARRIEEVSVEGGGDGDGTRGTDSAPSARDAVLTSRLSAREHSTEEFSMS
ncbi:hypothetical protein Taro_012592 [Colocasia esculenta]|uniref:Protein kinase domain-containing protein n=1 Tax=Colocasia esculenta TaxID=4460 RepID=A0A843UD83_COLES|nr:hypothetical protein [Colocasia esculenta]